jgi:hypothetical protein
VQAKELVRDCSLALLVGTLEFAAFPHHSRKLVSALERQPRQTPENWPHLVENPDGFLRNHRIRQKPGFGIGHPSMEGTVGVFAWEQVETAAVAAAVAEQIEEAARVAVAFVADQEILPLSLQTDYASPLDTAGWRLVALSKKQGQDCTVADRGTDYVLDFVSRTVEVVQALFERVVGAEGGLRDRDGREEEEEGRAAEGIEIAEVIAACFEVHCARRCLPALAALRSVEERPHESDRAGADSPRKRDVDPYRHVAERRVVEIASAEVAAAAVAGERDRELDCFACCRHPRPKPSFASLV